jgi:phage shock protein C
MNKIPKILYRSVHNKVFAGVCGGLGEYMNVDPVLIRLIWMLVVIATGFVPGVVVYIVAVIIVPTEGAYVNNVERPTKQQ